MECTTVNRRPAGNTPGEPTPGIVVLRVRNLRQRKKREIARRIGRFEGAEGRKLVMRFVASENSENELGHGP
jgi:hypothetical protein